MSRLLDAIEALNNALFRLAGLCTLVLTAVVFTVVVLRYAVGIGSTALQESGLYLHALIFMLAAAAGLRRGEHVRVDILYGRFSPRGQATADLLGTVLLLIPFAGFLLLTSWAYVARAWSIQERSMDPGGLPLVWLLKTLILVMAVQLILQAAVEIRHALHRRRQGSP